MTFEFTVETEKNVDDAVQSLETALKDEQFGVLWDFDLTGKLQEKGMDFNTPYRVLEVCNPKEANRVLNSNKKVGYFLPCKIVVYEEGEKTMIGMPKPTTLIGLADENLQDIADDVEERLKIAIQNAK